MIPWLELCVVRRCLLEGHVIARVFIAALLFVSHSVVVTAQTESPRLDTAERALVNALMRPDGDAFRQLLASDAVFLVPSEAHGPDAILEQWRPFLSGSDARIALTIESSMIAESGSTGQTTGTLHVWARTNKGMSTTPVGVFSIDWRLVDGRWKIATLVRGAKARTRLG
jgi:ketosteroid isomerase-like protein